MVRTGKTSKSLHTAIRLVSAFSLTALPISVASAQVSGEPPKPAMKSANPEAATLAKSHRISMAEAERQVELSRQFEAEALKIAEAYPDNFVATLIDRTPAYKLTLVFDKDVDANEVKRLVSPGLQQEIQVKRSRRNAAEILSIQQTVIDKLAASDIPAFVAYDFRTDKVEVGIDDKVDQAKVLDLIEPSLRSDVKIVRKRVSLSLSDTPNGYTANNVVWGGWPLHDASGRMVCTDGFVIVPVSGTASWGLSTAAHCANSLSLKYDRTDGSLSALTAPSIEKYVATASGRSYDYQVHPISPRSSDGYIWIDSNVSESYRINCQVNGTGCTTKSWANVDGNLPDTGYIRIVDAVRGGAANALNPTHPVGAMRCKYGARSGVSCGTIAASSAAFSLKTQDGTTSTFYGIVEVTPTEYMVATLGGDSGGPIFTVPAYNSTTGWYEISAAGTMIGGTVKSDGTLSGERPCIIGYDAGCDFLYMPIDRINDHDSNLAIRTGKGSYVVP